MEGCKAEEKDLGEKQLSIKKQQAGAHAPASALLRGLPTPMLFRQYDVTLATKGVNHTLPTTFSWVSMICVCFS